MVYVDNMAVKFGNMVMCHMVADTTEELLTMADKIGVNRKWIQDEGTYLEHFDISVSKKKEAIKYGAIEITMMSLGRMVCNREGSPLRKEGIIVKPVPIKAQQKQLF